jgi:hypothetical protein
MPATSRHGITFERASVAFGCCNGLASFLPFDRRIFDLQAGEESAADPPAGERKPEEVREVVHPSARDQERPENDGQTDHCAYDRVLCEVDGIQSDGRPTALTQEPEQVRRIRQRQQRKAIPAGRATSHFA